MRPYANRAPALAIEWNYRFGGYLPSVRHVRQSGIHRGSGFFSARRIECEFDERDELMQRLIFGKLARRVAAGEIVRAVLNREPPVQRIDGAREHRAELARPRIDAEVGTRPHHRVL
jgi:hypothetical protein